MVEIKRDKLKAFSIIGAILFIVYGALVVCKALVETGIYWLMGWYYSSGVSFFDLLSYIGLDFVGLSYILLIIVAAVIIFINKNSSAVFVPLGLLTYSVFSVFVGILVGYFVATFIGPTGEFYIGEFVLKISYNALSQYLTFVISVICALPVTIFLCVSSVTFMKKIKAVLIFLLLGAFAIGLVFGVIISVMNVVTILTSNLPQLENFMGLETIVYFYRLCISPFIAHGLKLVFLAGLLLVGIGMCSKPKVIVSADDAAYAEIPVEAVAEEPAEAFEEVSDAETAEVTQ